MKKSLFIVLIIASFIACGDKQDNESIRKEAQISGKITAVDSIDIPEKLVTYLYNETKADYDQIEIEVGKDGAFTSTLPVDRSMSISIYGDYGVQLLISPGDSIHIATDARFEKVTYDGKGGDVNTALTAYKDNNPTEKLLESEEVLSPQDYALLLDSISIEVQSYNKDFLANHDQQVLQDYVMSEEAFLIPAKKLAYALYSPQGAVALNDSTFTNSFNNLPEYKKEYDLNTNNPAMIANYLGYVWEVDALENTTESREKAFMNRLMSLENNDYLKKKILQSKVMNKLEDNNVSFYENHKDEVDLVFNNTPILATVSQKYDEVKKLLNNPELPVDTELLTFKSEDATQFIDEIITNANGKVIYIDNWATWCGPCKSEFKNASPALHEKFKDDVEFVYLCHQSKEAGYVPSISKFKIAGKHYFLTEDQSRPIFKQINLEGFPTYTIINKNGDIVLSDYIHRPSYAKTTEILTGLINEEI
ncbi:TlpA family protein disulfide reductase [Nonlabens ulvanivorans]|uniref:TlpA family protein disulfide reductase n=1 Tax=Nonlabens ulvanivorans TaxID=906888 RepID=UPI0029425DD7|nr:TlpA disulfide reductase family protein [Nonlabens ulvanivorans]WOI22976.1 TlpA disulfide reductase family protein [Nonlabens ulvanivorans]